MATKKRSVLSCIVDAWKLNGEKLKDGVGTWMKTQERNVRLAVNLVSVGQLRQLVATATAFEVVRQSLNPQQESRVGSARPNSSRGREKQGKENGIYQQ